MTEATPSPERPGADDERLAEIRAFLKSQPSNRIEFGPIADARWLLARLDDARESKAFWEARFNEAIGITDSKSAELSRLRSPSSADMVERAREIFKVWMETRPAGTYQSSIMATEAVRLVDMIATFASTVAREAREAAIEEAAEIAHRHCWLPAVGVREENDASRIEDAIRALSGTAPQIGWRPIDDEARRVAEDEFVWTCVAGTKFCYLAAYEDADWWSLNKSYESAYKPDDPKYVYRPTHWQPRSALSPPPASPPTEDNAK